MIRSGQTIADSRVLVLGLTFEENCPDLRNTKVIDVIRELEDFGCKIDVADPWANNEEAEHEYGLSLCFDPQSGDYDAVILAVPHRDYSEMGAAALRSYLKPRGVLYDLKGVLNKADSDLRL